MKREEAREGDIACFYAEKNFLKVKQAFAIDKVCFSFVKKGTKGDGVNIYMPIDEFDLLCEKILNLSLHKKIADEKQRKVEYPGAYSCTVGKDGSKKYASVLESPLKFVFKVPLKAITEKATTSSSELPTKS